MVNHDFLFHWGINMRCHRPNSLSHSSLWERPKNTVTMFDEKLLSCTNQEMDTRKSLNSWKCYHIQCPPQLLAPLVNMSKTGYENNVFAVYPLGLSLKIFTKIVPFHWSKIVERKQKCWYWINIFLQNMCATIIGNPRKSYN